MKISRKHTKRIHCDRLVEQHGLLTHVKACSKAVRYKGSLTLFATRNIWHRQHCIHKVKLDCMVNTVHLAEGMAMMVTSMSVITSYFKIGDADVGGNGHIINPSLDLLRWLEWCVPLSLYTTYYLSSTSARTSRLLYIRKAFCERYLAVCCCTQVYIVLQYTEA